MRISDWSSDVCSSDLREDQLAQEPGDVDPVFDQAGRGDVAMSVADMVGFPRALGEREVVVLGLCHHVFGRDEIRVVVLYMLQPGEVADRADRRAADLDRNSTRLNSRHQFATRQLSSA